MAGMNLNGFDSGNSFKDIDFGAIKDQAFNFIKGGDGGSSNTRTRLPRTNGSWDGIPGEGKWYTDNSDALSITNGDPVIFRDGRPDFSPWSKGKIKFKLGQLNGSDNDFKMVYKKIMIAKEFSSLNQAKKWLKKKGLTPHHYDDVTIQLIPTKLHANVAHIGSASDLRGGFK